MSEVKVGKTVSVHYIGTLDDGTEFDNSHTRGEPLTFQLGAGQMISGFDSAVSGMVVGESKTIRLSPEEAYGESDPEMVQNVPRSEFPPEFEFQVGKMVQGQTSAGPPFIAKIDSVTEDYVVMDLNHPLAGTHINFEVELLTAD
jgi:peptidylprolyl isomerase